MDDGSDSATDDDDDDDDEDDVPVTVNDADDGDQVDVLAVVFPWPSPLIKIACPLVLALHCGPQRHIHASTYLACRVAFVVLHRIAWVRRQRVGANPGGPPLLDL